MSSEEIFPTAVRRLFGLLGSFSFSCCGPLLAGVKPLLDTTDRQKQMIESEKNALRCATEARAIAPSRWNKIFLGLKSSKIPSMSFTVCVHRFSLYLPYFEPVSTRALKCGRSVECSTNPEPNQNKQDPKLFAHAKRLQ